MKKKLLTLGLALTTVLSLSACNGDKEKPVDTNKESVIETNDVKSEKDKDEKVKDSETKAGEEIKDTKNNLEENKEYQFTSLQEFYDSDDFQQAIKQTADLLKDQLDMKVSLEGKTLVYTYSYLEQMETTKEGVASIEESLDAQKGTLDLVYRDTNKIVKNAEDMKIKYVHLNKDGSVVFEKTYGFEK